MYLFLLRVLIIFGCWISYWQYCSRQVMPEINRNSLTKIFFFFPRSFFAIKARGFCTVLAIPHDTSRVFRFPSFFFVLKVPSLFHIISVTVWVGNTIRPPWNRLLFIVLKNAIPTNERIPILIYCYSQGNSTFAPALYVAFCPPSIANRQFVVCENRV